MLPNDVRPHATRIRELLYGHLVSRAICVVAQLGVPDVLAAKPLPVEEIATRVGAHAPSLRRLVRSLTCFGIFTEPEPGLVALTPLGATLRDDVPATARPTALLLAGEIGATWAELADTIRTGEPSFDLIHGGSLFDYLERKPEVRTTFDRSQAEGLALELDELISRVDFTTPKSIVDVGGSDGAMLLRLLEDAAPQARGTVFDLPGTAALAWQRIAERGLSERCEVRSGDFFESVPDDGDLYLVSHILHDWNDTDAVRLLRTCRAHMPSTAQLMVVDLLLDGGQTPALMDLYMLSLFGGDGGRERTAEEFLHLLERAGFTGAVVRRLPSGMGVITASPAGSP